MATFNEMVDEVRSSLAGYTLKQDRITYLDNAITTTDLAVQVGSADNLAKGVVEIVPDVMFAVVRLAVVALIVLNSY